ncbi:MAG TPA: peptidase S41, partial [Saprospiraceae bacterium]|nr:peptidase S41 [Saprospiraceae bacterium]
MKKLSYLTLLGILLCLQTISFAQEDKSYFTLDPTLSPDAKTIVFSYDGDLWKVPTSGGEASRLTAMDGEETRPAISPDGKWLVFSSTQMGNRDLYLMPLAGGAIKQLTYHQANDDVDAWSWDSQTIYFTSNRFNRFAGYSISPKGGTPKRLFGHYFNTVHNLAPHPTSGEIFFNESWESKYFAHRKRYKGAFNPDIKSYNPQTGVYKTYTDYIGKDFGATIAKDGTVYFMSDEANGEYNLYTFDKGKKKRLTKFKHSILWPKVSANGEKVVFRKAYQIFVYDVKSGKTTQPYIRLYKNQTHDKTETYNVSGHISNFNVSSDNKKIAFVSRGRLFVSDIKGKFIKELNT